MSKEAKQNLINEKIIIALEELARFVPYGYNNIITNKINDIKNLVYKKGVKA